MKWVDQTVHLNDRHTKTQPCDHAVIRVGMQVGIRSDLQTDGPADRQVDKQAGREILARVYRPTARQAACMQTQARATGSRPKSRDRDVCGHGGCGARQDGHGVEIEARDPFLKF